ncbi:alkane 1-monooxygenase [Microvirga zambiensis]|uniref:alkane 1-monooxygenase n=1 Tax=Microvirga zambiensis TaxID=1402137 RepID=UPI003CCDD264
MIRPGPEPGHFVAQQRIWHSVVSNVPHVVFLIFILLSTLSASTVTGVAFWSWLALVVFDEILPRVKSLPEIAVEHSADAMLSDVMVKKAGVLLFILFVIAQTALGSDANLSGREFVLLCLTTGFLGAIFAIPIAHELMHSRCRNDRRWAVAIMAMFSYPHFCLEHIHGHHRGVGTYNDPATARLGESIYAFLRRALVRSFVNSWKREITRLRIKRRSKFSIANRIFCYFSIVIVIHFFVMTLFGLQGALFFLIQGTTGIMTLESINYIEHYGLQRNRTERGSYEPVSRDHSWNSSHFLTNLLLFDLARHSDHHINPGRHFRSLALRREAPQLPVGYFGILWLTLLPPLWRQLMDVRVQQKLGKYTCPVR